MAMLQFPGCPFESFSRFHPSSCFPITPNKNPRASPMGGVQCRRIFDRGAMSWKTS
jgi:hypothetical protein